MHDWVLASENIARVLAAKGYHYQYVFARNAARRSRRQASDASSGAGVALAGYAP